MQKEYITHSAEETKKLAEEFSQTLRGGAVILLDGNLGSGKTTFTQGILEVLGAEKPYTSPTFVIMKEYKLPKSPLLTTPYSLLTVFHIDTYRIESKDLLDLGWKEILEDKSGIILLEWPDRVRDILPQSATTIHFEHARENARKITFAKPILLS